MSSRPNNGGWNRGLRKFPDEVIDRCRDLRSEKIRRIRERKTAMAELRELNDKKTEVLRRLSEARKETKESNSKIREFRAELRMSYVQFCGYAMHGTVSRTK